MALRQSLAADPRLSDGSLLVADATDSLSDLVSCHFYVNASICWRGESTRSCAGGRARSTRPLLAAIFSRRRPRCGSSESIRVVAGLHARLLACCAGPESAEQHHCSLLCCCALQFTSAALQPMSDRPYSSSGSGVAGLIPATQWPRDTQEEEEATRSSHSRHGADSAATAAARSSSRRRREHRHSEARSSRADAAVYTPEDSSRYAARAASSSSSGAAHSRVATARFGETDSEADERYAAALGGDSGSNIARDQLAVLRARAEAIVDAEEEERRREYEQRHAHEHRSSSRNTSSSLSRRSNRPASAAPSRSATAASGSHSHSRAVLAPLDHQPRLSPRPQSASAARPTSLSWVDEEAVYLIHNPNLRRAQGQQLEHLEASPSQQRPRSSSRHRRRGSRSRTRSRSRSASPKQQQHRHQHHRSRSHRSTHSHSRRSHSRSRSRARSRSRSRSRSPPRSPTRSILSVHIGDDAEEEKIEVFSPHSAREYRLAPSSASRPSTAQQQRLQQSQHAHLYSASPSRHDFGPYADPLGRTRSNDQRVVALEKQEEAAWKAERDAAAAASAASATLSSPRRTGSRSKFASLARRVSNLANAFTPPPVDINYEIDPAELDGLLFPEEEPLQQQKQEQKSQAQPEATPSAPEPAEPSAAVDAQSAPAAPTAPTPSRDRMQLSHARGLSHSLQVSELDTPAAQRHQQPQQLRQHSNAESVATEIYEPVVSASPSPTPQPHQPVPSSQQQPSHRIRLVSDDYDSSVRPPTAALSTATAPVAAVALGVSPFVDLRLPRGLSASEMLVAVQQALASPFANEEEARLFREWAREKEQRKLAAAAEQQQRQPGSPVVRSSSSVPPSLPRSQTLDSSDVIPPYQLFSLDSQQHQSQSHQRDLSREMEEKYNTPRVDYEQQQQQQQQQLQHQQRTASVEFAVPISSSPEPMDSARSSLSSPTRGGLRPSRVQTVRELRQSISLQQMQLQQLMGSEPETVVASSSFAAAATPTETPPPQPSHHHAHAASIPATPQVQHGRHYSIEPSTPARSVSSGATVTSSALKAQQTPIQVIAAVASAVPAAVSAPAAPAASAASVASAPQPTVAPPATVVAAAAAAAPKPELDPLSFDYDFDLPSPSLSWPNSPIASSRRASLRSEIGEKPESKLDGAVEVPVDEHKEQPQPEPQIVSPHSPPAFMQIPPQPSVDQYVEHYNNQYAQWMAQQKARATQQQPQQQQQQEQQQPEEEREKQRRSPARRTEQPHAHHPSHAAQQPPFQHHAPYPVSSQPDLRNNPQYRAVYAQYLQHFAQLQMQRAGLVGLPPPPAYAAMLNAVHTGIPFQTQMQLQQQQQQQAIEAARLMEEHQRSQQKRAARDERRRLQKESTRAAAQKEAELLRRRQHALAVQLREEEELRMLREERRKLDDLSQSGRRGLSVHTVRPASSSHAAAVPRSHHPPPSSSSRHIPDASFSELIASATATGINGASAHSGRSLRPAAPAKDSHEHVNPTLILATGFSPPRHSNGHGHGDRRHDAAGPMPRPPARPASAASAVAAASVAIELATEAANRSRATIAAATAAAGGRSRKQNHERIAAVSSQKPQRPLSSTQPRAGVSATDFAAQEQLDRRILDQQLIKTLPANGHGFRPSKAAVAAAAAASHPRPHRPSQPAPHRAPLHRQHSFSSRASLHTSEEEEWSSSSEESTDDDGDDASTVVGGQSSAAASSVAAANRRGGRNSAAAAPSTTITSHPSTSTVAAKPNEHHRGSPAMPPQRFDIRVHAPEEHEQQT